MSRPRLHVRPRDHSGKVGEIIKVEWGRVLVQASGKKWWYDKPAVERDGRYTRDFSKLVVGSKVKLARDYADFNDAPLGPLQPGTVRKPFCAITICA